MHSANSVADAAQDTVTKLLHAWAIGDPDAFSRLISQVYLDLKRIAHHQLSNDAYNPLLQTTGLVHEAYIRLRTCQVDWQNKEQFYATFARLTRQILVDFGRRQKAIKRKPELAMTPERRFRNLRFRSLAEVMDLNDVLDELEQVDPGKAHLVELRYFAGLSIEEIAATLGVSPASVKREWQVTRLWLLRRLSGSQDA